MVLFSDLVSKMDAEKLIAVCAFKSINTSYFFLLLNKKISWKKSLLKPKPPAEVIRQAVWVLKGERPNEILFQ